MEWTLEIVLNRPEPDHPVTLEPGPDLNIKVDNIKESLEITEKTGKQLE